MTGTVRLSGQLICANDAEVAVVSQHLPEHIRLTRAEPGCLSFSVTQTADPRVFLVAEAFANRDSFAAHQSRTGTSAWFAATAHIRRDFDIIDD
ncbi:putative quinol monooxygenase [Rhodobacter ferrooxidans]|uniref:Antibiotic biosynthesis monooxygenase n=1 Tax=Rhodobacter ferrooxidans TaxID=371731 RepID=C8RZ00_9RHOB|nr:antibiotic biosynthesis monooxygenase [Rhodobacter sp. SW2]EEW25957.1 Antibiotic biosynthesis monooxygenase [Rhodobacter sp. SW2]